MPELLRPLDGNLVHRNIARAGDHKRPLSPLESRIAYSPAPVVADPIAEQNPKTGSAIGRESTLAYRLDLARPRMRLLPELAGVE